MGNGMALAVHVVMAVTAVTCVGVCDACRAVDGGAAVWDDRHHHGHLGAGHHPADRLWRHRWQKLPGGVCAAGVARPDL